MNQLAFTTPRTARFYSLGEPGPAIQHVWFCLHGHQLPAANLAAQLVKLDTPERLLILPEALSRYAPAAGAGPPPADQAVWFAPDSQAADLADAAQYLDRLAAETLAACPPGTPVTILAYGHSAAVACHWLANSGLTYERLVFYAAVFPPSLSRRGLLTALPRRPVTVVTTTAAEFTAEADGSALLRRLLETGHAARLSYADEGPLTLAALGAGAEGHPGHTTSEH